MAERLGELIEDVALAAAWVTGSEWHASGPGPASRRCWTERNP